MHTKQSLEELSKTLTISNIADILLIKSNSNNINCLLSPEIIKKSKHNLNIHLHDLNSHLQDNNICPIIKQQFDKELVNERIDSLIDLVKEPSNKLKIKHLRINYYIIEFLIDAKLLKTTPIKHDFYNQNIEATQKLIDFINKFLDEDGCCDFYKVDEELIELLIKTLCKNNK